MVVVPCGVGMALESEDWEGVRGLAGQAGAAGGAGGLWSGRTPLGPTE